MKDAEGLQSDHASQIDGPAGRRRRDSRRARFVASGRTITFYGFLKAYVEAIDDADERSPTTPRPGCRNCAEGQSLRPESVTASGHETRPPARYTEPSLVAKLEELEIGRPSTYATIIRTITSRDYVFKKGSALVPTWLAFAVTRLLEEHFPKLVDYAFTAEMEEVLDQIADGQRRAARGADRLLLRRPKVGGPMTGRVCSGWSPSSARSTPASSPPSRIGDLESTAPAIVVRVGRYGTYVEDEEGRRANVADDLAAGRAHC